MDFHFPLLFLFLLFYFLVIAIDMPLLISFSELGILLWWFVRVLCYNNKFACLCVMKLGLVLGFVCILFVCIEAVKNKEDGSYTFLF